MRKYPVFVIVILLTIFFGIFMYFNKTSVNLVNTSSNQVTIAVGEGNPGNIALYTKGSDGRFARKTIDTGFRYVWTVRIGDARNDGKNRIYAGVGNSFFADPHGCQVVEFDSTNNFKKTVIDDVGDLRCKDLTIGNVYNNGKNQLVLGTHGLGIIRIYSYNNERWDMQEVGRNYIAAYDKQSGSSHAVPADKLPYSLTVQTAVHIVKVGDADNDGKNELLTVESDPLENPNTDHVLFVRMYKWNGSSWNASNIDQLTEKIPFKATVQTVDLDKSGKNKVLVSASHHHVLLYSFNNGKWDKEVIDQEEGGVEDNMKAISVGPMGKKNRSIVVSTGGSQAAVYQYDLVNGKFQKKQLVNLSKLLDSYRLFEGLGDNTLDAKIADLDGNGNNSIVFVGEQDSGFSGNKPGISKFGWEGTNIGFEGIISSQPDDSYKVQFIDFRSGIALDVGKLSE